MALEIKIRRTMINVTGVKVITASIKAPNVKEINAIRRIIPFLCTSGFSERIEFLENKIPVIMVVKTANKINNMGISVG